MDIFNINLMWLRATISDLNKRNLGQRQKCSGQGMGLGKTQDYVLVVEERTANIICI